MNYEIRIRKNTLAALAEIVSEDETRPPLRGINIRRFNDLLIATATDGRRLALANITDEQLECATPDDLNIIIKPPPPTIWQHFPYILTINVSDVAKTATILMDNDFKLSSKLIGSTFPKWEAILNWPMDEQTRPALCFSAQLLMEFLEAMNLYKSDGVAQIYSYGPTRPFIITSTDRNFIGVMMTAKSMDADHETASYKPFSAPEWLKKIKATP